MLKLLNNLTPFIEDNYEEYGVREYAKLVKISPPTASKILKGFEKEGLLLSRPERKHILFRADRENKIFKTLSLAYWQIKLKDLAEFLSEEFNHKKIILFGSLVKTETKKDSDIDIVMITKFKKDIDLEKYERKLGKKIQPFTFKSLSSIKSKELKTSIFNGYIIQGEIK